MKIYIASSWRHEHAVRLLTELLRRQGHEVWSFVENRGTEEAAGNGLVHNGVRRNRPFDFEAWITTHEADDKFCADLKHATKSDAVVYLGPSGTDAWAEVGAAWGCDRAVYGITGKGEQAGLMRKMVFWCKDVQDLVDQLAKEQRIRDGVGLGDALLRAVEGQREEKA